MERSLKAQHRSCFVVLPSATRVEQIHLRHVFISGETTEDFERSDTKNAQNGKKGSIGGREKRTGPFLPFFRDLRERGRGRSISPTPCFWDKGYSPCSASCRRCGVFSESESRTRTGIGSGGLNDHKHRRRAKSIGRAGERERFQIA